MVNTRDNTMQEIRDTLDDIQQTLSNPCRNKPFSLPTLRADQDFFHGRTGENFNLWLDRFNRYGQAQEWTDDYKRAILPTFLWDAAEVIFNGIPMAQQTAMTFEQLVTMLHARFSPAHAAELKASELHNRRQFHGESILDYSVVIQQLTMEAYSDLTDDV
uniref:Retrotransposon gag domain-containing protein n=1 Tax=Romanomermis culicivorax TaxID=13658 RepID=A0A915K506_ROMCU